ncbi:hypothetical protein [Methylorubrum sp. POS3]|uniref:hypothetical protein n=1 Tax=Methylorubrum sp. POS3 TaxID=2998492 RepID=UPI003727533A
MLFDVPERLLSPADGALPDAPGVEPEPASFAPVALAVPELLAPTDSDQELERPAATCATVATRGRPANAAAVIPVKFLLLDACWRLENFSRTRPFKNVIINQTAIFRGLWYKTINYAVDIDKMYLPIIRSRPISKQLLENWTS